MSQTAHYILLLLCDCCGWHVEYFICVVVSSLQKPFQTHLFDWRFYFCSCFLQYMSDYLLKWFALCYRTVVCPVCLPCLCILSVCNVGALWPNGWMDQDEILARSHRVHPTENRDLAIPQFFAIFRKFISWSQNRKIRWLSQNQRKICRFRDNFRSWTSVVSALQRFNFNGKS